MKKYNFSYWDIQVLSAMMCGKTRTEAEEMETEDVEQLVFDNFDVSQEQLEKIVEVLAMFTIPVRTPLGGKLTQGFVSEDVFIVKGTIEELTK